MLKTLQDVARALATDITQLQLVDYATKIRWKDTHEIVAYYSTGEHWVLVDMRPLEDV